MIHERIKALRKSLDLSGEAFGEKIGISKTAVSYLENGKNSLTESNIILICNIWDVSEDWLRHGTGDMFNPEEDNLDYLIGKYGGDLSPEIEALIKTFLTLTEDERKAVDSIYKKLMQFDVFKADNKDE